MNIRKAEPKDSAMICKISCNELGYKCSEEFVINRLNKLDSNKEVVFVAEIDSMVVGYIHAQIYELLYYEPMINILGIAVSSEYRRNRVGSELMRYSEKWAKQLGINIIRLNSGATRKDAHKFYRSIGFNTEKEQICFTKTIE